MDPLLARGIRDRAKDLCEYCQLPARVAELPMEIDHVVARKHGGPTRADNLALACFYCNSYKGSNIAGIDPDTGNVTRLFHPRHDAWSEHFEWSGAILLGLSPIGRATIETLRINHPDAEAVRCALIDEGVFPPTD